MPLAEMIFFLLFRLETFPSVTCLAFNGGLSMGVGTATGQILLYDIRANKPYYVKDHMYNLPIKRIAFHEQQELVLSVDSSVVKIWDRNNVSNTVLTNAKNYCIPLIS